jgi:hypothetical protein
MTSKSSFEKHYEQPVFWYMKENPNVIYNYESKVREFSSLFKENYSLDFLLELLKFDLSKDKSDKFEIIINFPNFTDKQILDLFNELFKNKKKIDNIPEEKNNELNKFKKIRFNEWEGLLLDFHKYEKELHEKSKVEYEKHKIFKFEFIKDHFDEKLLITFNKNKITKNQIGILNSLFNNLIDTGVLSDENDSYEWQEEINENIIFTFYSVSSIKIIKALQKLLKNNLELFQDAIFSQYIFDIVESPSIQDIENFKNINSNLKKSDWITDQFFIINLHRFNWKIIKDRSSYEKYLMSDNDIGNKYGELYNSLDNFEIYDEWLWELNCSMSIYINNNINTIIDQIKKSMQNENILKWWELGLKHVNILNLNEILAF